MAPDDWPFRGSMFISPVTSIANVWLPLARPLAVKTGTWTSVEDLSNMSTSDTKTPSTNTRAMPLWSLRTPIHVAEVPFTVNVPETVAPDAGDVILTVGGVVSGGHVKPGTHGNCAKACSGIQAKLKIS